MLEGKLRKSGMSPHWGFMIENDRRFYERGASTGAHFIVPQIPLVLRMVRGLLLFRAWLLAAGQKPLAEQLV
jgi:hypothetical protein